jgi:hypothetical protein
MKKLIFIIALSVSFMLTEAIFSQFSIKVNFASQPIWGPVGYDYVEYYYLPEIQIYYNVSSQRYIYLRHNRWVSSYYLPQHYRNYDVYHAQKIVINEPRPYLHHNVYKKRYSESDHYSRQESIRDSHEVKYYQNKRHPQHKRWMNDQRNDRRNNKYDRNKGKNRYQNNDQNQNENKYQKKDNKKNNKQSRNKNKKDKRK